MLKKILLEILLLSSFVFANTKEIKEYYESGAIKRVTRYDEQTPYLIEMFYEDGTLMKKILIKDGEERILYTSSDESHNHINKTSKDGQLQKRVSVTGDFSIYYIGDLIVDNEKSIYTNKYSDFKQIEEKNNGLIQFKREYEYGILLKESYSEFTEKDVLIKDLEFKNNILRIKEHGNTYEYYLNGNKKLENILYVDEKGNKYNKELHYDESEKLIYEKIYINNQLEKEYQDKNYSTYLDTKIRNFPYHIKYSNGNTAYEKYITLDGKIVEKYFNKKGTLIYSGEYYPNLYKMKIKKMAHEFDEGLEFKSDLPKNIKRFSYDGDLIFESKFEDNESNTIFRKISFHQNKQVYFDEKETINKKTNVLTYELKRYDETGNLQYSLKVDNREKIKKYYKDKKIFYEYILKFENNTKMIFDNFYYKNGKIQKSYMIVTDYTNQNDYFSIKSYDLNGNLKDK